MGQTAKAAVEIVKDHEEVVRVYGLPLVPRRAGDSTGGEKKTQQNSPVYSYIVPPSSGPVF